MYGLMLLFMGTVKAINGLWKNGVVVVITMGVGFLVGSLTHSFLLGVLAAVIAYIVCCVLAVVNELSNWG